MEKREKPADIDAYIAGAAAEAKPVLKKIRQLIKQQVKGATESISYQMPAFRLGNVFIYFAAFKHHIGVYPPVQGDKALQNALEPYRGEKGNLKFPLTDDMPYELIGRVAVALSKEYGKKPK